MTHTTLIVRVGRGASRPLCTVSDDDANRDDLLSTYRQNFLRDSIAAGVDTSRISFEHIDGPDEEELAAEAEKIARIAKRTVKTTKGKRHE